ncbi:MAG: endopeptidase La [Planctomycetes bacterium]|nr:endopeptidase La [Planctomycetota bacterium]MCB9830625.1 endopeptidase La [Planctomycetota bacterium]MCB9901684.1 endopeptidase La [Planctomycetota bacterium]
MVDPEAAADRTPIPDELPGLRLASTVVFPFDVVSVPIDRPRSRHMLDETPGDAAIIACFLPREPEPEGRLAERLEDFLPIGVACRVIHRMRMPNDTVQVVLQGLGRIRLEEVVRAEPYLEFRVSPVDDHEPKGADIDARIVRCMELVDELVQAEGGYPPEMVNILRMNISGAGRFADLLGAHLRLPLELKRHLLAAPTVRERLQIVEEALAEALARNQVQEEVGARVKAELTARQREQLLRAQLRAIHRELGEGGDTAAEAEALREAVEARGLPEAVEEIALREVERLGSMPQASGEQHVVRTYVQWLLDLPWEVPARGRVNLRKARHVLDAAHYGLQDVKERILEHLAVQRLANDPRAPVLCLVGPPGVGKTSLGRSVADAMGRPFARFSVGGVRDESEIRGHRRTYVGAMPGKILQTIRRAGSADCLFLIDEIDKMGADARGDPSSALLEVLDPSQNEAFTDHYLDVPYDLSHVFFMATANDVSTIPGPLRDRMEIVHLPGYTRLEKLAIAKRHLVPAVLEETGLTTRRLVFEDAAILDLIDRYTREAGVRGLRRQLARLARRRALEVAQGGPEGKGKLVMTPERVAERLGPPSHEPTVRSRDAAVGVTAGLAWTPAGGDLLFIEATLVPGSGHVKVTGRLGEVMRESAEAAFTYVRSKARELDIDPERIRTHDVHVHVPDGATPKDGPSAGVTIATCLASLFTGRPARPDVAMTGEITLKGRVLAVGGVKEKVLAAHRAGIQTVLLPEGNRRDLAEIPPEVQAALTLRFTKDVRENIDTTLLSLLLPDDE